MADDVQGDPLASPGTATRATRATRAIGASDSHGWVFGQSFRRPLEKRTWWQRLLGIQDEPGTYFRLEHVEEATALHALDSALDGDGCFCIESGFDSKMDFYRRRQRDVWIDCWFFESQLDEVVISREGARRLVQILFTSASEREVLDWLNSEGAILDPADVAV